MALKSLREETYTISRGNFDTNRESRQVKIIADKMKTLYVIGNGFDRHHDINCSYADFHAWLLENHSGLFYDMDEIYGWCDGDWWSDFENNLGDVDVMEYTQWIALENPVDLASDHCDSMWNDAQIAVENQMSELYQSLQNYFEEWVSQLKEPNQEKRIFIDQYDAVFLNFNYTRTLEDMYGIRADRVLHIHGEAGKNDKLVIGHGLTENDLRAKYPTPHVLFHQGKLDEETASCFDIHDELAWDEAFHQVAIRRKPVKEIIQQNEIFFNGLKNVSKVCVYGLSFSDVDIPYMIKINECAPNAHWEISCFSESDRSKVQVFAAKYGVKDYSIVRLSELCDPNQLTMSF